MDVGKAIEAVKVAFAAVDEILDDPALPAPVLNVVDHARRNANPLLAALRRIDGQVVEIEAKAVARVAAKIDPFEQSQLEIGRANGWLKPDATIDDLRAYKAMREEEARRSLADGGGRGKITARSKLRTGPG